MKIIDVKDLDEAVIQANKIINDVFFKKFIKSIAFTGGRFGVSVLQSFDMRFICKDTQIFQTDERFVNYNDESCIQRIMKTSLFEKVSAIEADQLNFFSLDLSPAESINSMVKLLEKKKIGFFDLVFLSLGEDGHLAGDFGSSEISVDDRVCFTEKANKHPRRRISYASSYLLNSENIFIAAVGKDKELAFNEFIEGIGMHSSKINFDKNIIFFKDQAFD